MITGSDLMDAYGLENSVVAGDHEPPTRHEVDPDEAYDQERQEEIDRKAFARRAVSDRLDACLLGIGSGLGRRKERRWK